MFTDFTGGGHVCLCVKRYDNSSIQSLTILIESLPGCNTICTMITLVIAYIGLLYETVSMVCVL